MLVEVGEMFGRPLLGGKIHLGRCQGNVWGHLPGGKSPRLPLDTCLFVSSRIASEALGRMDACIPCKLDTRLQCSWICKQLVNWLNMYGSSHLLKLLNMHFRCVISIQWRAAMITRMMKMPQQDRLGGKLFIVARKNCKWFYWDGERGVQWPLLRQFASTLDWLFKDVWEKYKRMYKGVHTVLR